MATGTAAVGRVVNASMPGGRVTTRSAVVDGCVVTSSLACGCVVSC